MYNKPVLVSLSTSISSLQGGSLCFKRATQNIPLCKPLESKDNATVATIHHWRHRNFIFLVRRRSTVRGMLFRARSETGSGETSPA